MKRQKLCGIYKIENMINGKIYIGQSVDIYKRWADHISSLNKQTHINRHLQNAWNKYGNENFKFEIIKLCAKEKLNIEEMRSIKAYNSFGENGYNLTLGGEGNRGWIMPDNVRLSHSKAVILLNTGDIFESLSDAYRKCGIYDTNIALCCKGIDNHAGKYNGENAVWMYLDEFNKLRLSEEEIKNKIALGQIHKKFKTRKVICITTNQIFDSTKIAADTFNLSVSGINSCLCDRARYCGTLNGERLVWKYYDEFINMSETDIEDLLIIAYEPVNNNRSHPVICLNTFTVYDSISKAEEDTGISSSSIISCCSKKTKSAECIDGMRSVWMYYSDFLDEEITQSHANIIIDEVTNSYNLGKASKVILLNTGEVFDSMLIASKKYKIKPSSISSCCNNRSKIGGKDSDGNNLVWMFYDEYITSTSSEINNRICSANDDSWKYINSIPIILLNSGEVFDSISDAANKYNISVTSIVDCCKSKSSYAGKDNDGNPLVWMYKTDFEAASNEEIHDKKIAPYECIKNQYKSISKKVVLLNTLEVFEKIKEAANKYDVSSTSISGCCLGKYKYAGKNNEFGPLVWRYYDDYITMSEIDIKDTLFYSNPTNKIKHNSKQVICLETNKVFDSIKDAALFYDIKPPNISNVLNKPNKSAGKHPITNEKLHWLAYDKYLEKIN